MAEKLTVEEVVKTFLPDVEIKEETTIDDLKPLFEEKYVGVDLHKKELSSLSARLKDVSETNMKKALSALGVSASEYSGKKVDEITSMLQSKIEETLTTMAELKNSGASGSGKGKEEFDKLAKELADYKKLTEEKDGKINELTTSLELTKGESAKALEAYVLDNEVISRFNSANWTDESDDIVKTGVKSTFIDGKYIFKPDGDITKDRKVKIFVYLNDADQTMVKDGVNQMTVEKLFEKVLKDSKRFKENNGNPKPIKKPDGQTVTKSQQQIDYEARIAEKQKKLQGS